VLAGPVDGERDNQMNEYTPHAFIYESAHFPPPFLTQEKKGILELLVQA
jgi:hypothetical protein